MIVYPGATRRPSSIVHAARAETRGIVIHWTGGHESGGDLSTLDGPVVDCHFYVTKKGKVYQFLDPSSQAWHAKRTANRTCVGIEHEGKGEAWTPAQLGASARLAAWLCGMYNIPVRKVEPPEEWRGFFGHVDLFGFRANDHTDTVPADTGWSDYLRTVAALAEADGVDVDAGLESLPDGDTLRLVVHPRGKPKRAWSDWEDTAGPLRWVATTGLKPDTQAALAFRGQIARGATPVVERARSIVAEFLK